MEFPFYCPVRRPSLAALSPRARIGIIVVFVLVTLHLTLSATSESYGRATSIGRTVDTSKSTSTSLGSSFTGGLVPNEYYAQEKPDPWLSEPRANATMVMLARNSDVQGAVNSIQHLEDRFNRKRRYPWVFLNDEPFDDEFKRRVRLQTDSEVFFGEIPKEHWVQQEWINETLAAENRKKMGEFWFVPYTDSVSYRNMCRFNSGFFFRHPLLAPYKWYWRVEPDVDYTCDIQFDPFIYMRDNNKTYSFTISLIEFVETIPTLWDTTKEFMQAHPEHIAKDNAMHFVSDDGESYNMCHFWSNFEIADLDFWRSPAYMAYFEYLDSKGGFYYERWGDAPVHSLAAALLLPKDKLHFFAPIGYEHHPHNSCPTKADGYDENHCQCGREHSFHDHADSCLPKFLERVSPMNMGKGW